MRREEAQASNGNGISDITTSVKCLKRRITTATVWQSVGEVDEKLGKNGDENLKKGEEIQKKPLP